MIVYLGCLLVVAAVGSDAERARLCHALYGSFHTGADPFRQLGTSNSLVYREAQVFGVDNFDYEGRILGTN